MQYIYIYVEGELAVQPEKLCGLHWVAGLTMLDLQRGVVQEF